MNRNFIQEGWTVEMSDPYQMNFQKVIWTTRMQFAVTNRGHQPLIKHFEESQGSLSPIYTAWRSWPR